MNYRYPVIGFILLMLSNSVLSFSPPPPDQQKIDLCRATNGTVNITYIRPDCGPDCDIAVMTVTDCNCPSDSLWNSTEGCIPKPTERQNILIEIIDSIINFIYKIFGIK